MKALNSIISTLVVIGAAGYAVPGEAAMVYRTYMNHASAVCTGSMPADRDMLRARSMGVANIDTAGLSDVRCGGVATPLSNTSEGAVIYYETAIRNSSAVAVDVNCSLADGLEDGVSTVSTKYPKTLSLAPGEMGWIGWDGLDTGGTEWNNGPRFLYPSLMCQLPTDVSISYTAIYFETEQ